MAIRWSPSGSKTGGAPRSVGGSDGWIVSAPPPNSVRAPSAASPRRSAAIRSLSLWRRCSTPWSRVGPEAKAATTASVGAESGIRAQSASIPRSPAAAPSTSTSKPSSEPSGPSRSSTRQPIRRRVSGNSRSPAPGAPSRPSARTRPGARAAAANR